MPLDIILTGMLKPQSLLMNKQVLDTNLSILSILICLDIYTSALKELLVLAVTI